jgi:hypothetical protein
MRRKKIAKIAERDLRNAMAFQREGRYRSDFSVREKKKVFVVVLFFNNKREMREGGRDFAFSPVHINYGDSSLPCFHCATSAFLYPAITHFTDSH